MPAVFRSNAAVRIAAYSRPDRCSRPVTADHGQIQDLLFQALKMRSDNTLPPILG